MMRMSQPLRAGSRRLWRLAFTLGSTSLVCGVLLGGLSAWFLGSVAIAGLSAAALTFNFHIPGSLVRLFALGRTAARYGERLVGHQAALIDQSTRRVALFKRMAMAPETRRVGWQLGDQTRLTEYLDDVEDIDFASLRADLPGALICLGLTGTAIATAVLVPLALVPIAALLALVGLSAHRFAKRSTGFWTRARSLRRAGAGELGAAMAAIVPLQAEGEWAGRSAAALHHLSQADEAEREIRFGQAQVDALAGLVGPLAALAVVLLAWFGGFRDEDLLVPVFLAFSWLAWSEGMQGLARIVFARLRRETAHAALEPWMLSTNPAERRTPAAEPRLSWLRARSLQRRAPDGRALGEPVPLDLRAGRPTVLSGASGIGKTSLLKQVAGWLGEDEMDSNLGPLAAADRDALSMLSLHDAAILTDTVRENLFAPDLSDAELWQALDAVELSGRIRDGDGLDSWIGQDSLSLGEAQRLNLARAWLSQRPLILLDEPLEHLPADQGFRILERLVARFQDRIMMIASHTVHNSSFAFDRVDIAAT